MALRASPQADRTAPDDDPPPLPPRLSPGVALLLVTALSGALWFGLIRLALALF